jgi:acyl carrier protein
MIPSYFVELERIPLNPNGKVDRKALPPPDINAVAVRRVPAGSKLEKKLAQIWSDVLNMPPGSVGIDDNFFEVGGHSLKATLLAAKIRKELDVNLKLTDVFMMPTIRELSSYMENVVKDKYLSITYLERKEYYPLSPAQNRLFILQQFEKESILYNMPAVMRAAGQVDEVKFEHAFLRLINRHESLRTSFPFINDEPVQRVHNPADIQFKIEYYKAGIREQNIGSRKKQINRPVVDAYMRPNPVVGARRAVPEKIPSRGIMGAVPEEQERRRGWRQHFVPPHMESDTDERNLFDNFIRPFDLSNPPLLRVGLMAVGEQEYVLVVDMHHIISDGSSIGIFIKDFLSIYSGEVLPDLPIQYKDFTYWQDKRKGEKAIGQMEEYWLDEFAGEILPYT